MEIDGLRSYKHQGIAMWLQRLQRVEQGSACRHQEFSVSSLVHFVPSN